MILPGSFAGAPRGEGIYRQVCTECHGDHGEGVKGKYDGVLSGDESIERLTRIIHKSMPEDAPEKCRDKDAETVARYIHAAFYSRAAREKSGKPRIELARLTVRQYREAISDLFVPLLGERKLDERRGLQADYFASRKTDYEKRVFNRIDKRIDFNFGAETPASEGFKEDEFAVLWRGSIIAEDTGWHEFIVMSENGYELKVNNWEIPLIDGYVASGGRTLKRRGRVFLLGGRLYPLELKWFKYKGKTASVRLMWKAPHREEELIPARNLFPELAPLVVTVSQAFPPDDSSVGYERGVSVSASWDEAVSYGAIEITRQVIEQLDDLSKSARGDEDRLAKLKKFCREFAERAFRRPLSEEAQRMYVDSNFERHKDADLAVKRSLLLTLKSPRFLYIGLGNSQADSYSAAERLSFGLWDTIPDQDLIRLARKGELLGREQIRKRAIEMLDNPRSRAKLRSFFEHWLEMERGEDLTKDAKLYPGFDKSLVADLRISLHGFIEQIVWMGSGDYRELLLASEVPMNRRMAEFYEVKHSGSDRFELVEFGRKQRSGLLTHPYLLAQFAYPGATSPIHRGVFITRNMLGRALRAPPEAVEFKESDFDPSMTMREKVTEMTKAAVCQNCHAVINPLGFSLEHYDAVGRYRKRENRKRIDAAGEYESVSGKNVRLRGARDLSKFAAHSPEAQRAFIEKLFHHLVKQPLRAYGDDTLDRLHETFVESKCNIRTLAVEIVTVSAAHGIADKMKQ